MYNLEIGAMLFEGLLLGTCVLWRENWSLVEPRRFYLTGDITNLYPFIQSSLEWPLSELFSTDVSLWNEYKYIAFKMFSFKTFIILHKMLIITVISNEKTNELTMYAILRWNVTIFYRQNLASFFQLQEKSKECRNCKWMLLSSRFIAFDSYVKIVCPHVVVSAKHDILHFRDNAQLLKDYPKKVS